MSWTEHLNKAKLYTKASRFDDALRELNQALLVGGDREYTVYDSRAALYEKQGKLKNALQDVKNVIKLAPAHWQGYARASRLFLGVRKLDEATTMADLALSRLDPNDVKRRQKLSELKEEVLDHRRRQVYHFGKLPVEIITAIFEMVVAGDWSLVLTIWRVSKHWHNIALNTPNLWSILVLSHRHPARHAQRWIKRSKGRIRELSLRSTLPRSTVNLDGLLWDHLRICRLAENHDIAEYIGGRSKLDRLSGLEELQLGLTSQICDLLLSMPDPKLRRLTLDGPQFSWDILASNQCNLTSLEVRRPRTSPSLEEVMAILESNPNLEQFILDLDITGMPPSSSPPPPLTMSKLYTLDLAKTHWTPRFFELVAVPSLQTLRLSLIRVVGLLPLIEKRPDLLHLSVNSCIIPSSELLQLLRVTPSLKTLALTRLDASANVIVEALAQSHSSDAILCPALTHLEISHCPDVKTGPIVTLLKSRNPQAELPSEVVEPPVAARIKTLRVDGCPQIEANCIPWIRAQVKTFSCIYLPKQAANWRR
ncbi:hypothetical protein B0H17DRAFT_1329438 [Mycena rosella]|uniref:F-box domain-containing protein n=1 Tax=Mycena rosella TaxID=1033263 RepID=A0AAD7DND7_MYCRO|nr:hypothetical protein B0H17DRAFT_1329438 [Mycena rosella]